MTDQKFPLIKQFTYFGLQRRRSFQGTGNPLNPKRNILPQFKVRLQGGDVVDFPGRAETEPEPWFSIAWEVSGVRCAGDLLLTNFRIVLVPSPHSISGITDCELRVRIPLGVLEAPCKILPGAAVIRSEDVHGTEDVLELRCHDLRVVHIVSLGDNDISALAKKINEKFKSWQSSNGYELSHCFTEEVGEIDALQQLFDGRDDIEPERSLLPLPRSQLLWRQEFDRMGLQKDDIWRISEVNVDYSVSNTYPSVWWVPSQVSDDCLKNAAKFRSKGRLPLLTWRHKDCGSLLLRSSQPLSGLSRDDARALADCSLMEEVRKAAGGHAQLGIFDCRDDFRSAFSGTENPDWYIWRDRKDSYNDGLEGLAQRPDMLSLELDNIHEMHSSWQKLKTLIENGCRETKWLGKLGKTKWLDHCRKITEAGVQVARYLHAGGEDCPVVLLVHCTDGWDRTPQVCSIAQILLDPYYRTAKGLCVLIEKDWLRFGHKFSERARRGQPIFLQFLFCVAAVVIQFPHNFEFSLGDLELLVDLWLSGWTSSLLQNSECERTRADYVPLWSVWLSTLEARKSEKKQPCLASPTQRSSSPSGTLREDEVSQSQMQLTMSTTSSGVQKHVLLLRPITSLKHFELWHGFALRFDSSILRLQHDVEELHSTPEWPPWKVWLLPKEKAIACHNCHRDFSFIRLKHRCRACGHTFCNASTCTTWGHLCPELGYNLPVWLCRRCELSKRVDMKATVTEQEAPPKWSICSLSCFEFMSLPYRRRSQKHFPQVISRARSILGVD